MKYMGSKARIAKHILPIILKNRLPNQWYVEPFCGGCNCVDKVTGNRIASDSNIYLIALLKELSKGWIPPKIDKDMYAKLRLTPHCFPHALVGWAGIGCSYSGKWFGGFAGETKTKIGTVRDYQLEAINNVLEQNFDGILFFNNVYYKLLIPENSIIYCDPPYANTTEYSKAFDHEKFWTWCRNKTEQGHSVFISEYKAPDDFECVWEKEVKSSLSANGRIGGSKKSIEKLFVLDR